MSPLQSKRRSSVYTKTFPVEHDGKFLNPLVLTAYLEADVHIIKQATGQQLKSWTRQLSKISILQANLKML